MGKGENENLRAEVLEMFGNNPYIPFVDASDNNLKISHDRYDVFVNGDFVGQKELLTARSEVDDVSDFLHSRGFDDFQTKLDGDHYDIDVPDPDIADAVKDHLNVYLKIR